jgi:N-formylglutamate deformylase
MKLPFVISLPHCSGKIPEPIRSGIVLNETERVDTIDLGTREIFSDLPAEMILCAQWNRLVVDLNRPPDQRDAKGPVALVDYHGRSIYGPEAIPDESEIVRRLSVYYNPYHRQLENAVQKANIKGLLDCHSLKGIGPPESPDRGKKRRDITLGNNGGPGGEKDPLRGETTCAPEVLRSIKQVFELAGFSVSLNVPYAGGFIVRHYGPALMARGKIALQIEINQDLYLAPETETIIPEKAADIRSRMLHCLKKIGEAI